MESFVASLHIMCLELYCRSDLKLVNNGCKGRWSPTAVVQQVHTSIVVADVSGEHQELCFSGQVDVCNPLALLPEWWRNRSEGMDSFTVKATLHLSITNVGRCMCLTSFGFDSPARWGFGGAGCKHQAAHWESLGASLLPAQVPLRPRLLPQPPPESPGTPTSPEEWLFFIVCVQNLTNLTISLKSAPLPCFSLPSFALV